MKKQIIKIYDPIFRQTFLIFCNYSFQTFHKEVLNEEYKGNVNVLDGYCINTDSAEICVWLNDYKSIPTLVHELQHAMTFALYDRCFVDRREAELPAFYMEFLISEFLELSKGMEKDDK